MRQAAEAPKAKASAQTTAPPGCQFRSRKTRTRQSAPTSSEPSSAPSLQRKSGVGLISAISAKGGEKISDCGSATCGEPAKTKGVQNGDNPLCRAPARNWSCGWKCALASQGTVTTPDN